VEWERTVWWEAHQGLVARTERAPGTIGVGVMGLVELGLFVQASSSKPEVAAEFDLGGGCTCEMVVRRDSRRSHRAGHEWRCRARNLHRGRRDGV
jgi:hypothetical protein